MIKQDYAIWNLNKVILIYLQNLEWDIVLYVGNNDVSVYLTIKNILYISNNEVPYITFIHFFIFVTKLHG